MAELRRTFRPEFLNRIDEIVLFRPLTRAQLRDIVRLMLKDVQRRLASRRMTLDVTDAAVDLLVERGYDPTFGARPLRRTIQRTLETRLARALVAEAIRDGTHIHVDARDGEIVLSFDPAS